MLTFIKSRNILPALFLLVLTLFTYSNALNHPFMMDDRPLIVENNNITSLKFLQMSGDQEQNVYFRPVAHLFILIPYLLFGLNPVGFHAMNLILFFLACVSIYELIHHLFKDPTLALIAGALFATHPINGILVNYKTASTFSVMLVAMNYSLLMALPSYRSHGRWKIALSVLCFAIALLCHESAAILPFFIVLILNKTESRSLKESFFFCLPHFTVLSLYLLLRTKIAVLNTTLLGNFTSFSLTPDTYLASLVHLILFYIKNLFFLNDIVLMWSTPIVGHSTAAWISFFLLGLILLLYVSSTRWRNTAMETAVLWMLLGIMPLILASISRPNLGFLIESHWMFYSTLGFCLLAASLLVYVNDRFKLIAQLGIGLLILSYVVVSRGYNALWHDEKKYCSYIAQMSPRMDIPYFWIGYSYMQEDDYARAKVYFLRSIRNNSSDDWYAYLNLGFIEQKQLNPDQAFMYYKKALAKNPQAAEIYNNLGALLIDQGDHENARKNLNECLRLDPRNILAKKNLASMFLREGETGKALKLYQEILAIDPNDQYARQKLGNL